MRAIDTRITMQTIVSSRRQAASHGDRKAHRVLRLPPCLLVLLLAGCSWFRGAAIPIWHDNYSASAEPAKGLVVLLPGIGDSPNDFVRHGFVELIKSANPSLDVVAVDAPLSYYVRGLLSERVHHDIVKPRLERYQHIWLVGISLGGLGAMSYAADYPQAVDGVVLLAPFLGTDEVVEEVRAAGGVRSWTAPVLDRFDDPMRRLAHRAWSWARTVAESAGQSPAVYLGYGDADCFVEAHAMLADAIPANRIRTCKGEHDWVAWTSLFEELAPTVLRDVGVVRRSPIAN